MARRKRGRPARLLLLLPLALGLPACASQSVSLIHPQTGATASCGAAGVGFMAGEAGGFVEGCIKGYESRGYVPVEKLTPQQRADLERRGLLPKE